MSPHHAAVADDAGSLLATLAVASIAGHVSQLFALLPGWAGGILGGLVVHGLMRLVGPAIDVHAQRVKARLSPAPVVIEAPVARARRVLVVDDHEACRVLIAAALRAALPGVHVDEARSAAEARGLHGRYHHGAIVADLVLADEMGHDLLRAIGGPGDVLTSGVADALALDAAAAGCGAIAMRKPPARDELVAAVTARLDAIGAAS
jgi:CheY-like chemotaxis protein